MITIALQTLKRRSAFYIMELGLNGNDLFITLT